MPSQPRAAAKGCLTYFLSSVGLLIVFFGSWSVAYHVVERPIVAAVYGEQAWAKGVRVVGRHGETNDGRRVSSGWMAMLAIGSFVGSLPVVIFYYAILRGFGLWIEDELESTPAQEREKKSAETRRAPRPHAPDHGPN